MGQPAKLNTLYPGFRPTRGRFCDRLFFDVAPSSEGIWTRFFFCLKDMELVVLSWEYGTPILSMKYWILPVVSKILKFLMIIVDDIRAVISLKKCSESGILMFLNVSFRGEHILVFFQCYRCFSNKQKTENILKKKNEIFSKIKIFTFAKNTCFTVLHRVTITQTHPECFRNTVFCLAHLFWSFFTLNG